MPTFRALVMPVAFVGLAMAAPESLAMSGPVARQAVEHTVGRAEAVTGQVTQALRDLSEITPTSGFAVITHGDDLLAIAPAASVSPANRVVATHPTPPRPGLIDLPPPM